MLHSDGYQANRGGADIASFVRSGSINANNSKLKVLIAADSAEDRDKLYSILDCCFELESACSCGEALTLLEGCEGKFGLLILSSSLPCDGVPAALGLFRRVKAKADIPVLLVVSDTDSEIIDLACEEGVTDFILRPFVPSIVRRRAENALLLHSRQVQSSKIADILLKERQKDNLFSTFFRELEFEYFAAGKVLKLSEYGAKLLNTQRRIVRPLENRELCSVVSSEDLDKIIKSFSEVTPDNPLINIECRIKSDGQERWYRLVAQAFWKDSKSGYFTRVVGKTIDITDFREKQRELEDLATRDTLTGLYNKENAKKLITGRMKSSPGAKYALVMLDIDCFKEANDTFGHSFGDDTLKHLAKKITGSIRTGDIAARMGGDEFLIFMQYKGKIEPAIKRIFNSLIGRYEQFELSVSMGVAESEKVGGSYEQLLECADKALYSVKRSGKKNYCFYDESMVNAFTVTTPIESNRV